MFERSPDILRKDESMPKRLWMVSNLEMDAYVNQLRRGATFPAGGGPTGLCCRP